MKKITSLGLTLLVLVAISIPVSSWIPVVKIHPSGNYYAHHPQIAVSAYGVSYITWEGSLFSSWEIYWVRISPAGTPGPVQKISVHPADGSWDDPRPQIAVSNGTSYVTWQGYDGSDWEIYWVKIDPSGAVGPVQMISQLPESATENDRYPRIAADASGNSYVAWYGYDGNDYETYWVKIDSLGVPGNIKKISTHPDNVNEDDGGPRFCVDASGNSYIVWGGHDGNDGEVYWVKIDPSGVSGVVQKISTHPENIIGDDRGSQIAVSNGTSYITWQGHDGHDEEIYWVKIDPSGVPGTVQKISTHPDNVNEDDWNPQIAADSYGNSYVTWRGHDGNDDEIYWVKIDPSGVPGTVQKISTHPDNMNRGDFSPQIAAYSGNCCVTWFSYDGNDDEIYWVKIDPSGVPGTVQKISTHPDNIFGSDTFPQIAVDASGNSFVVWKGFDGSFARVYFVSTVRYPFDLAVPYVPETPNEQMQPLAQYRISQAEAARDQAQDFLSQAQSRGIDTSGCEDLIEKGDHFLVTARTYYEGGNYIAANICALRALHAFEEAIEFLRGVQS